jgi:hypothetical protein
MSKVLSISGTPTVEDFAGSSGTPIVVDVVGKKAYFLAEGDDVTELAGGGGGVQANWTQADNTQDDYIKNKPTLGTLAAKSAVDYSTSEVTNKPTSLPASDVSAWAKAATKPTYTASEVGTLTTQQIQSLISIRF